MKRLIVLIFIMFVSVGIIFSQSVNVTSPAAGVTWNKGATKTITWTSPGCQSGDVKINIFKNSIDQANFVLQLTGPNTGSKSWTIPSNFDNGTYYIRVKTDPAETGCLGDSEAFTIGTFEPITTFRPGAVQAHFIKPPDLKMTIIPVTGPTTETNKKTLMEFKVDNIGEGASKATKMKIFMGQNNTDTWDVKALKPGRFMYKTKEVTPDYPGYYMWSAIVDENNNIGDKNRDNNYAKYKMIIKGSDLVVCFLNSVRATLATKETIRAYVKNVGSVKSLPCKLRFYMEKKGGETFDIPALSVGEVFKVDRREKWFTLGNKTIRLTIDYNNDVPEENEKNNFVESSIKVITAFGTKYALSNYICSNGNSGATLNSVW